MRKSHLNRAAKEDTLFYSQPASIIYKIRKPHPKNVWCEVYGCLPIREKVKITELEALRAFETLAKFIRTLPGRHDDGRSGDVSEALLKLENYFQQFKFRKRPSTGPLPIALKSRD